MGEPERVSVEGERLGRRFYRQDPVTVARQLLGQRLVHVVEGVRCSGLIVETEAYLGVEDKAAHSFNWRKTRRTQTMFRDGGTAYVFLNYGIHRLLNIVVARPEEPKAVLLRALEPVAGLDAMYARRPKAKHDTDLCSGPGKLGAAMGIELRHDGTDLATSSGLLVERVRQRSLPASEVVARPRVGVDYAGEWAEKPLRFYVRGNPHVSRP